MSGSARPKRRRAAGTALRYERVRGRVTVSPSPERQPRVKWDAVLRWLVVVTVTAEICGLCLVAIFWGPEVVWGDIALAWPGGPYGVAATTGLLVVLAVAALVGTLTRVTWPENKVRSLKWIAASLPGHALAAVLAIVLFTAMRPKRRNRGMECYSEGGPCWLREEYPYVWAIIWATALSAGAAVLGVRFLYRRRRPASDANSPAQPST
ncbi:hypothetical protein FE633_33520 [Streptomyces montanus]|uniref:Uncharacterized protein n=1 Tax=Streptomyces montanus TaxID=2580423 RepID=A0A5R9FR06_9ACTN|nr:hypothetical protein [Streptomyces montanus]TLS41995.1 hypothetical protein FE633_33520 [Streptomyces montanus]